MPETVKRVELTIDTRSFSLHVTCLRDYAAGECISGNVDASLGSVLIIKRPEGDLTLPLNGRWEQKATNTARRINGLHFYRAGDGGEPELIGNLSICLHAITNDSAVGDDSCELNGTVVSDANLRYDDNVWPLHGSAVRLVYTFRKDNAPDDPGEPASL